MMGGGVRYLTDNAILPVLHGLRGL